MNRTITVLVVLAVVAVGVVAALNPFGDESTAAGDRASRSESANRELIGPHSPEPGALPGTLVVTRGPDCVIQLVDLARMRFSKAGPETGCYFEVAPDGSTAAVLAKGEDIDAVDRRFELVEFGDKPERSGGLGRLAGDPVWSLDSMRLAACHAPTSEGTTVAPVDGGPRETLSGCWPAFGAAGAVATRSVVDLTAELATDGIYVDGVEAITLDDLIVAAGESQDMRGFVLGHASNADGAIAVSLVHVSPDGIPLGSLQLWRDQEPIAVTEIPLFLDDRGPADQLTPAALRDVLRLSPDAKEVGIVLEDGGGALFVADVETGNVLGPLAHTAYDWSPQGRWLAVAAASGVDVYGPSRDGEPTFQLPLETGGLAWR